MYKLIKDYDSNEIVTILRTEDNTFIPLNLANTDYQAYLAWLDEGNEPEPAEEV